MKYKVGDKVRVKSLEWYNNNTPNADFICCEKFIPFTQSMSIFCDCVMTIKSIERGNIYLVEENLFAWTEDMFEGLADCKENIEIILNDKNYIIDIEKAKELGVIKEKDSKCRSWEDFVKKYVCQGTGYDHDGWRYDYNTKSVYVSHTPAKIEYQFTREEAVAIDAFSKLLKLRRDWIGNWNPDYCNSDERKYCIEVYKNEFYITNLGNYSKTFSFPTEEMAEEFLECFRNLFDQCKCII